MSWTGTASNATVGHKLGVAPKMVIVKNRSATASWLCYHSGLTSAVYYISLNQTAAETSASTVWNSTAPTSSVFSLGSEASVNGSGNNMIAYCFADTGNKFFKAGSYTGNGNANGSYILLGFRPAWALVKKSSGAGDNWNLFDNKRNSFNPVGKGLFPDDSGAEYDYTASFDFLSNGFKLRDTSGARNASGATYIYMAFAEQPFVNSNGVPNNAR